VIATLPSGDHVSRETVNWGDGTPRVRLRHLVETPRHTYTAAGRFTVTVSIVDTKGRTITATAAELVTVPSGSYSGGYFVAGSEGAFSFYVSGNHAAVQDVSANVRVTCAPGNQGVAVEFVIDNAALARNGSFSTTVRRSGVYGGSTAAYRFTLRGQVRGVNSFGQITGAGSLVATMTYNNGTAYKCTSNRLPWQVARDQQPTPQPTSRPSAGSLSGAYYVAGTQGALTAYVAPDRQHLQDMYADVGLACAPSTQSPAVNFVLDSLKISSSGAFQQTKTEGGVYKGVAASSTFTIKGHFHGVNMQGVQRAAGSLSARMTYNNGTAYTCTSNTLPFTLLRTTQPAQSPGRPPAGSYTGDYFNLGTDAPLTFSIPSDRSQIQNFSTDILVGCIPGGASAGVTFSIDSISVAADGSFTKISLQSGMFAGFPASYRYVVKGHAHGTNSAGHPRIAGSVGATVTYTNGVMYTCKSNTLHWDTTGP